MKKTTLIIEGMACNMCESHIDEAIRKNFCVNKVTSSHKKNETVIMSENELNKTALKDIVENAGYILKKITVEEYEKKKFFI